jgi:hypothetical protein
MAAKECEFEITAAGGGDLEGNMFGKTTGRMSKRQTLEDVNALRVIVLWKAGGTAPQNLLGRFMFSAAPTASSTQIAASPFKDDRGKQLCYTEVTAPRDINGNQISDTFDDFPVDRDAEEGKYELTFVAQDTSTGTQWSEDPEFDIES